MPPYTSKDAVVLAAKISTGLLAHHGGELVARLRTLLARSPRISVLSVLKYLAYFVLFLNSRALPFAWSIRVFWPLVKLELEHRVLRFRLIFASKKERKCALTAWAENLPLVGSSPFDVNIVSKHWATFDELDFLGCHLSNSSYAKALDVARAEAIIKCFPTWTRNGGAMALAATHFNFIREISPLVRYETRLSIGCWDQKWLYVITRFVTYPSSRQIANLTPLSTAPPTPVDGPNRNGSINLEHAVAAAIQPDNKGPGRMFRTPVVEPDGALLHCVTVSQGCFKWGRITVPPAVVLASEGFTKPYADGDVVHTSPGMHTYSHSNPPPNWIKSQALRLPPHGSTNNYRAFLRGQWRDAPEGERWWEEALGGSVEAKRKANLESLKMLKLGMEQVQAFN